MFLRMLYILLWFIIGLPVCMYACYKGRTDLWEWAYYFDNDEDGFDGGKGGFYSKYLGEDIRSMNWFKRGWTAYKWSALRNPCFNLRKHPYIGVDIRSPESVSFEGNTYHHEQVYSFEPDVKDKKWYKVKTMFKGKSYTSRFFMIPMGSKYLYIRFGLKLYPCYYYDPYWINKIQKEGWPEHKHYGLNAITIRLRNYN